MAVAVLFRQCHAKRTTKLRLGSFHRSVVENKSVANGNVRGAFLRLAAAEGLGLRRVTTQVRPAPFDAFITSRIRELRLMLPVSLDTALAWGNCDDCASPLVREIASLGAQERTAGYVSLRDAETLSVPD